MYLTQDQIKNVFPESLMDISVRGIHNDMIKTYYNGGLESVVDSVTQKVMRSDEILRSFIPTPKLRYICGCNVCIIPKDVHIDLNIFRTNLVIGLQQRYIRRYTRNSSYSTKRSSRCEENIFQMVNVYMLLSNM